MGGGRGVCAGCMELVGLNVQAVCSYELQSKLLKGGYIGDYIGKIVGVIKEDTRSLDYSSYELQSILPS